MTILPTGDEVRPIGTSTRLGEIVDTNSVMLAAQAREVGCAVRCLPAEPDDPDRIASVVQAAVAEVRGELCFRSRAPCRRATSRS